MNEIQRLLTLQGTVVVDVRTMEEYTHGHLDESINIPLDEIPTRLDELGAMKNIILCCASGGRSMSAKFYLGEYGIDACDGGAWTDVHHLKSKLLNSTNA